MGIEPGKYIASPVGGGMGTAKNGNFRVGIRFKIKDSNELVWWTGTMFEGGVEICTKTLALVGFRDDLEPKNEFGPEYVNTEKEVELDMQAESWEATDKETGEVTTKSGVKVKWVNEPGGGMKFGNVEPQQLRSLVANSNLRAEMMKARKTLGIKTPGTKSAPMLPNSAQQTTSKPSLGKTTAPPPRDEPSFDPDGDDTPF